MSPLMRVSSWLLVLVIFTLDPYYPKSVGVLGRSVVKRALPQFMEYDSGNYQQPPREHRTHIVKIHPKKSARSNDPVLGDVTNFQGIGNDHNAFGGPKYAGQYYPTLKDQGDQARGSNFSFGNLLSGLALWNLANEFNMYSSQDRQVVSTARQEEASNDRQMSN